MVTHGTGESQECLRDWLQVRGLGCLRTQYTDYQHVVAPHLHLLAILCCLKSNFFFFHQNVPWPYKTLKSYVTQRNHENFEGVLQSALVSQLVVQSLVPGTQGTGVFKEKV